MSRMYRLVRDKVFRRVRRRAEVWPALLLRGHRLLPAMLRPGERAYRFPGGMIYLDIREKPWIRKIALEVFERPKVEALRAMLRPGMTFVDVGANTGFFALIAARLVGPTGRVLAIEPEPENCTRIQRNIELNGYGNIDVVEVALADADGEAQLHLASDHGHHSLLTTSPDRVGRTITVPQRTLDSLLAERGVERVDVMKIDVEGFEVEVLRGARQTVQRNPDVVLLMDVHESLGVDAAEVCDLLNDLGLSTYQVKKPYNRPTSAKWHPLELLAKR